jgi:glyoxylase-like metal-dependent hydrolase (beta-lactamase superfamily II)
LGRRLLYTLDVLIQGYPGKAVHHGGLGWSTVPLLRGQGEVILIDTGSYSYRDPLLQRLGRLGLGRDDVTSVILTHCHWDHICNYPLFSKAKIFVPNEDIEWALGQPIGTWHIPEFHVEKLGTDHQAVRVRDGDEFLPGLRAVATPGHTPGHLGYVARGERADLIFTGDAAKNQAELVTGRVDMTLDLAASRTSIRRLKALAAENPSNVIVCGHDRLLGLDGGQITYRSELRAAVTARLSPQFEKETVISLVRDSPSTDPV